MPRIFISYKRADKERVFAIQDKIEAATGEKCWIDLDGIESDAQFANVIIKAIDEAEIFLFMYSMQHAQITDYEKDWTIREIGYAEEEGKRIVFVNIDKTPLTKWFKLMFKYKQQIDATSDESFKYLLADLQKWLGKQSYQVLGHTKKEGKANYPNQIQETNSAIARGQYLHLLYSFGYILVSLLLFGGLWSNRDMFPERMQPIHYFTCIFWLYLIASIASNYLIFKKNKVGVFLYNISSYVLYFIALIFCLYMLFSPSTSQNNQNREDMQFMWIFSFIASLPVLISSLSLNIKTKEIAFYKTLGIDELTQKIILYTNIALLILILIICFSI